MKAQVKSRSMYLMLFLLMCMSLSFVTRAEACGKKYRYCKSAMTCCKKMHTPVAVCTTGGTNIPLPPYVCCGLTDKQGRVIWGNQWVAGSCKNAHPMAQRFKGCSIRSHVYGTHAPIIGNCQYSASTRSHCYY